MKNFIEIYDRCDRERRLLNPFKIILVKENGCILMEGYEDWICCRETFDEIKEKIEMAMSDSRPQASNLLND